MREWVDASVFSPHAQREFQIPHYNPKWGIELGNFGSTDPYLSLSISYRYLKRKWA